MSSFIRPFTSSVGKKYIMAVTGLLLGGFLLVHAAGNSSIFWGQNAFNNYASHLHSLGILINLAEAALLFTFILHVGIGLNLYIKNSTVRNQRYAVNKSAGGRTLGSRTMFYTGLAILAFLVLHLFNFHFADDRQKQIFEIVNPVLNTPVYTIIYAVAMLVIGLHTSHGFWSFFQSLGVNHPKYDRMLRITAWTACIGIAGLFLAIVLLFPVLTRLD